VFEAHRLSYLRRIYSCITQLKAQGPCRTCNESNEEDEEGAGGAVGAAERVLSERDQTAFLGALFCTVARRNPAACGANQGNGKRQVVPPLVELRLET